MPYCTTTQLEDAAGGAERLLQLSDFGGEGDATAAAAAATRAIAKADATINSYAQKLYRVPFDPVPDVVALWSAELAVLYMRKSRGMMTDDDQRAFDRLLGTRELRGELEKLANGEIVCGVADYPEKGPLVVDQVGPMSDARAVSRAKLAGF